MTAPYRLLAVDLDGTLLDPHGVPHPQDVRALRAASRAGVVVSIVTGRLYSGTRGSAEALGIGGPVACAEGSHLVRVSDHATLAHHGIPPGASQVLRGSVARHGPAVFLFGEDGIVHDEPGVVHIDYVRTWSPQVRLASSVVDHPLWEGTGLTGVVAIGSEEQVELIRGDLLGACPGTLQVATFPVKHPPRHWALFARATGATKGSALSYLATHHGVATSETICVGDWLNDVAMFAVAGRSYAMGHAPADVKRAATDVLEATVRGGGGIAAVVEENFGIRVE